MKMKNAKKFILLTAVFSFLGSGFASANLEVAKLYKSALGMDEKPKCISCHVDKLPKKEDGKHENNEYGKKLMAAKTELKKETIDEEVLKSAGKNETAEF